MKFEYMMTQNWKKVQDLGQDGWELVSVGQNDMGFVYFLKKQELAELTVEEIHFDGPKLEDEVFGTYDFGSD